METPQIDHLSRFLLMLERIRRTDELRAYREGYAAGLEEGHQRCMFELQMREQESGGSR